MSTAFIMSFDFHSRMPVLENSKKNSEIINAVIVNPVTTPTRLLPKPILPPPPREIAVKAVKKDVIIIDHKKQQKLREDKIAQQLLADLKKHTQQKKLVKQKNLEKEFAKELRDNAAKTLQKQLLQEKNRIAGARSQQVQGEVNKYKALILQAISQYWLVPPSVNKKLSAELTIRIAPGGMVLDVQIIKSSGDETLDRSARAAVLKASPLPVPLDADAFELFRQFVLKVKPENLLARESWVN